MAKGEKALHVDGTAHARVTSYAKKKGITMLEAASRMIETAHFRYIAANKYDKRTRRGKK